MCIRDRCNIVQLVRKLDFLDACEVNKNFSTLSSIGVLKFVEFCIFMSFLYAVIHQSFVN